MDIMDKEGKATVIMEDKDSINEDMLKEALDDSGCMDDCRLINDIIISMQLNKTPDADAINVDKELEKFLDGHKHGHGRWPLYAAIAAVAAVILSAIFLLWSPKDISDNTIAKSGIYVIKACENANNVTVNDTGDSVKICVPRGKTYTTTMPDGTAITLNSGSKLSYPKTFDQSARMILMEGEAYFNVKKDSHKPFIVKSKNASVTVLGTIFNFKDYAMSAAEITLYQGKVHLTDSEGNISAKIRPGQHAKITNSGKLSIEANGTAHHSSWKDGCFYFDENTLGEIMVEIGRWYNVNVEFMDTTYIGHKCHFAADRTCPLEKIVTLLNRMEKCHVEIKNGDIVVE